MFDSNFNDRRKRITARYVHHILTNPYRYSVRKGHILKQHARLQPEVHQLVVDCFLIITPYSVLGHSIHFILIYNPIDVNWLLVSNIIQNVNSRVLEDFIAILSVHYQVGELHNRLFYIPIMDKSLQNAYYRLISFLLEYAGAKKINRMM